MRGGYLHRSRDAAIAALEEAVETHKGATETHVETHKAAMEATVQQHEAFVKTTAEQHEAGRGVRRRCVPSTL